MTSALSPAKVSNVILNEEEQSATVVIPDKQLSLAIGKEGQNVRLAVKLTGWRIDIRSASDAEKERAEAAEDEDVVADDVLISEITEAEEEIPVAVETSGKEADSAEVPVSTLEKPVSLILPTKKVVKKELRFAEEIAPPAAPKPDAKTKKKKKVVRKKESAVDGIRLKKQRRDVEVYDDEEAEY